MKNCLLSGLAVFVSLAVCAQALEPIPTIERRLPPKGVKLPVELHVKLELELEWLQSQVDQLKAKKVDTLDAEVFVKALRYSLINGEYFRDKDFVLGEKMVTLAKERLAGLEKGETPWHEQRGALVRGLRSKIDGSVQPYGLFIPEELKLNKPVPLLVWLHGRGDTVTDMHFINRSLTMNAALGRFFDSQKMITVAPFGRQCIGWKHSGEIDIFEAIEQVKKQYKIDADRIVLAGFSMGGAGTWHVGAHYTDQFAGVYPGAGFVDVAKYNRIKKEDFPVWYEQTLWGVYDVPGYVRNLFNVPITVYTGEEDRARPQSELMVTSFAKEGVKLEHLIGPGMGHKYHPEVAKKIQGLIEENAQDGINHFPPKVSLQTKTLRYPRMFWVEATGLKEHWKDSRVDAEMLYDNVVEVTTKNVTSLNLLRKLVTGTKITIDGQEIVLGKNLDKVSLLKTEDQWSLAELPTSLRKKTKLQGPIDDAFMEPFLVVTPDGKSNNQILERWVKFEMAHFDKRWRELMRGKLRVKRADQVSVADISQYNLILWGSPESNSMMKRLADKLPVKWGAKQIAVGGRKFDTNWHVPQLIYPNPLNQKKYVVINSGHTFREGHDRTNSLQNPKLPDWVILDMSQLPDNLSAGKVVAADFFDEQWRLKK